MSYFQGAQGVTVNGGSFGPDYSRHTTYNGDVHRTNDYSRHTTNYGGYSNYGQHAERGGSINNYASTTMNNGYQPRSENRRSPRPPPDEAFNVPLPNSRPNSRSGQQRRPRFPQQRPPVGREPMYNDRDSDQDVDDDSDVSEDEEPPMPPPRRAQRPTPSGSPRREQPRNRSDYDSIDEELKKLSPDMQRYILGLKRQKGAVPPTRHERDLEDRMAEMRLGDAEPSRHPTGRNSPRSRRVQKPPRDTLAPPARFAESYRGDSDAEEFESDDDLPEGSVIRNINSNNVNSTTVVDSHNDNSTKTDISKGYSAR